mgnify:CR=1 FL=1
MEVLLVLVILVGELFILRSGGLLSVLSDWIVRNQVVLIGTGAAIYILMYLIKRPFLAWIKRFFTSNNTRLGFWLLVNIVCSAIWIVCAIQAFFNTEDCAFLREFTRPEDLDRFVRAGGLVCEYYTQTAWVEWSTLGWSFLAILYSWIGAIVDVPIAFSDEVAGKLTAWRAHRAAVRTAVAGATVRAPENLSTRAAGHAFLGSAIFAILGDVVTEQVITRRRR